MGHQRLQRQAVGVKPECYGVIITTEVKVTVIGDGGGRGATTIGRQVNCIGDQPVSGKYRTVSQTRIVIANRVSGGRATAVFILVVRNQVAGNVATETV